MSKRKKEGRRDLSAFDRARNELFSQIRHCGVLSATEEQRDAWFKETMEYISQRYSVTPEQLAELDEVGRRYCEPVIPHGNKANAQTHHGD